MSMTIILLVMVLTGVALLGTLIRVRIRKRVDFVDWFVGAIGTLNGIGYIFVIWGTHSSLNPYWEFSIIPYDENYWLFPILSLFAIVSGWFGAALMGVTERQKLPLNLFLNSASLIRSFAWLLFLFGVFAYWVYSKEYGGFVDLLKYSPLIRSGLLDKIWIDNPWSFLQRMGGLSLFSSFLFFALILEKRGKSLSWYMDMFGLCLSIAFSLYVLYSWMGRVAIVTYCAVFPLSYFYSRRSLGLTTRATTLITLFIVVILALPFISHYIDPGRGSDTVSEFYLRELSFPAASFFASVEGEELRYFYDLAVAPLYILPSRIWKNKLEIDTATDINTKRILGYRMGEGGLTGGVPVDFITFSYMQLGVIGVGIIGFLFCAFLVWLERFVLRLPGVALRVIIHVYIALMISSLTVLYADPVHIIQRNFHFIIGIFGLFIIVPRRHYFKIKPLLKRGSSRKWAQNRILKN